MILRAPNGVPGDENPEGLIPVVVFPDQGLGSGWGPTTQGVGEKGGLPEGYNRTINMTVLDGARFSPSFGVVYRKAPYGAGNASPLGSPPSFLLPWRNDAGQPIVLLAIGSHAFLMVNAAAANEADATVAGTYSGACYHDNGAGTEYLYAGTFTAATGVPALLNRRTPAGTWTEDADVNAKFIASAAGAMWRSTSDYQVSVCPAGSEPFTIASWGSSIQVGTNAAKIVNVGVLGASAVWFKEDGIWFYDETDNRHVNRYDVPWSPYNFPFVEPDGEGGLYSSTANGELVHISQFGAIDTIRLNEGKQPGRDTPAGQIVDMTIDGADLLMLMRPAYRMAQPSGMKVLKTTDNFGTFTDYTANLTDRARNTLMDLSSLDTLANGDAVLVGFDDQFLAVQFVLGSGGTVNGTAGTLAGAVSTGASSWATVALKDGTASLPSASTTTMTQGGVVAIDVAADISGWAKATYNAFSKYWLRLTVSVALDATVNFIAEAFIVRRRAAPDFGLTNNNNGAVWEASGALGKVLRGRRRGGEIIVDDIYTLTSGATAGDTLFRTPGGNKLTTCGLGTANSPDGSLVVASRDELVQFPLPATKEPTQTPDPVLAGDGANDIAAAFYPQPVDLGFGLWRPRFVEIIGEDLVEESDGFRASLRMDETNAWWTSALMKSNHPLIEVGSADRGMKGARLHSCVHLLDAAATEAQAPSGTKVVVWMKPLDEEAWRHRAAAVAVPAEA